MLALKTARLVLREWIDGDWPVVWAMASDKRVTRYQTKLRLRDAVAARKWVATAIHNNEQQPRIAYSLAVVSKDGGEAIGWLNWEDSEDPERGDVSFGYALLQTMWRRGYASEAVQAMLAYVFDVQKPESVYATCATSNPGSAGVLEKAGLTLVERWMHRDQELDLEEEYRRYRLDRTQWLAAR